MRRRLIVLVPDELAGNAEVARKVHAMALQNGCNVFFLTLVGDDQDFLSASRDTATMSAITSDKVVVVNSRLVKSAHWLPVLREIYRPGDTVVCQEGQLTKAGFLKNLLVEELLKDEFRAPVITISTHYNPRKTHFKAWLKNLVFWAGCLAILTAFTFLEIWMDQGRGGPSHTLLLIFMLVCEIATLWTWNGVASR